MRFLLGFYIVVGKTHHYDEKLFEAGDRKKAREKARKMVTGMKSKPRIKDERKFKDEFHYEAACLKMETGADWGKFDRHHGGRWTYIWDSERSRKPL